VVSYRGEGEVSSVFQATDVADPRQRPITIQLIDPGLRELFDTFEATLERAGACDHPRLSKLVGWGRFADHPYVAHQDVRGRTLSNVIERKQPRESFSPRKALSVLAPVCHALIAVHKQLPHAVVTPTNILVEQSTSVVRLANIGFGWFKLHAQDRGALDVLVRHWPSADGIETVDMGSW
jgi:serine/threonine protein kinase